MAEKRALHSTAKFEITSIADSFDILREWPSILTQRFCQPEGEGLVNGNQKRLGGLGVVTAFTLHERAVLTLRLAYL